jgi:hypothetical protein
MRMLAATLLLFALSGVASPQKPKTYADIQTDMVQARQHLTAAKDLVYRAGTEWGGHRMNALKQIDAAIAEVDRAEQYAKAHHFIK